MAQIRPVWFLPRTRDRPPVDAITLGNIISSPSLPEEAINYDPSPPVPHNLLRKHEEFPWSWSKEFSRSSSGGVFASFLQMTGIGGDFEATAEAAHTEVYNADSLVTEYFIPNADYIAQVVKDEGVKEALAGPSRKKRVYMITGIKTAYGATLALELMKKKGIHAQIGADLTTLGAPATIGSKGASSAETSETYSAGESNFVFGFKLRELRYRKGRLEHGDYTKGALYGREDEEEELPEDVNAEDLDVLEISREQLDMHCKTVTDFDGEDVDYVTS